MKKSMLRLILSSLRDEKIKDNDDKELKEQKRKIKIENEIYKISNLPK
jgi:hypothetical protein